MRCRVSLRPFLALVLSLVLSLNVCGKASGQDIPPAPEIQQTGPHNTITLRAAGMPGHYTGFDLIADEQVVAPVRFTSHDLIWSAKAVATKKGLISTLVFEEAQTDPACGLRLEHSRIAVTLQSEHYPIVAFDLHLAAFDAEAWQQTLGAQPFHFLTLAMPDATVWHQGGWLFPTPRADLFPLLLDPNDGAMALSAAYNREWSRTPPLSAHTLPVIGLWSPARKAYAVWDFQATRLAPDASGDTLAGHAENDLATGFCNRLIVSTDPTLPQSQETIPASVPLPDEDTPQSKNGLPPPKRDPRTRKALSYLEQASREYDQRGVSKFVALVSPPGGADSRQLVYPKPGTHLASQAVLMFSTDLPDTGDPNRFLWQQWWNTPAIYSSLPHVPRIVETGRLSQAFDTPPLPAKPNDSLIVPAEGEPYLPGSLVLSRPGRHTADTADAPALRDEAARLARLQADASALLKYARSFQVDKERCAYWLNPLAGEWTPALGGEPATTLHNAQGWAAAQRLLALYRAEREKAIEKNRIQNQKRSQEPENFSAPDTALLPTSKNQSLKILEGVFTWATHVVWMRDGFAGEPAIPTAKDNALAAAFLLDYYFTFKDDPLDAEHRTRALRALDLAQSFAYRAMILRAGEAAGNNRDEAFQWMPRMGVSTADKDKARGIADNLDLLAQVAVHTGDPILLWAVQGNAARLSRMYLPETSETSGTSGTSREGATSAEDADGALSMIVPPASADVQVLCGEKAALAFNQDQTGNPNNNYKNNDSHNKNDNNDHNENNGDKIVVTSYHCTATGDFAFTLHRLRATGASFANAPICASVTFPYADLRRKPVAVRHGNVQQRVLQPGAELARDPHALWSLRVSGLRDGDTVIVGKPELSGAENLPCAPPLLEAVARSAKSVDARSAVPLSPLAPPSQITGTRGTKQRKPAK